MRIESFITNSDMGVYRLLCISPTLNDIEKLRKTTPKNKQNFDAGAKSYGTQNGLQKNPTKFVILTFSFVFLSHACLVDLFYHIWILVEIK